MKVSTGHLVYIASKGLYILYLHLYLVEATICKMIYDH